MAKRTLYQVLGIPQSATDDEIKRAYKTLARRYHPDFNQGNPQAENAFKAVGQAYEVLSDPQKRDAYDDALAREAGPAKVPVEKKFDLILIYFTLLIILAVIFFFIDTPKGIYFLLVAIALEIRNSIEALRNEMRR